MPPIKIKYPMSWYRSATYCPALSIPSNRCFTFPHFYDSIILHQYEVNSIDLRSWYRCLHPSSFIHTQILQLFCNFVSASSLREMFYLWQYLFTKFPQAQSYSISSRIFYMCLSQKPSPSNFMLYQSRHLYTSQPKTGFQDSHLNSVLL